MNSAAWTWNDTFALILTGVSVVFIALVLLIFIISIMGKISTSLLNKPTSVPVPSPAAQPPVTNAPPAKAAPAMVVESGINEEIVAVISAAVAAMGTEENTYQITGIQKSRSLPRASSSRNAWALAGQLENTQPF